MNHDIYYAFYFQYIVECHAQTLLPQYLAMYRITVNDVETYVVVMRNVFSPRLSIHKKYDLKVSLFSLNLFTLKVLPFKYSTPFLQRLVKKILTKPVYVYHKFRFYGLFGFLSNKIIFCQFPC